MNWNRSDVIARAREGCTNCRGLGFNRGASGATEYPCNCVLRNIFKACYAKFRYCNNLSPRLATAKLERIGGPTNQAVYGLKHAEYIADFCSIGKKALADRPLELQIFKFCFLLGVSKELCARRLQVGMGQFNHAYYRTQQLAGLAFRATVPFGIFPIDEYWASVRINRTQASVAQASAFVPVRAPLAVTAHVSA